ncbi:MAG: hypothetical protein FIA97_03375 [Methylococcaceae bacterium]|nr:hypothetical protein [Methylococcaceae bacterium]
MATTSVNPSQLNALNDLYRAALQAKSAKPEDAQQEPSAKLTTAVNKARAPEEETELQRRVAAEENPEQPPGSRSTNLAGQELGRLISATA